MNTGRVLKRARISFMVSFAAVVLSALSLALIPLTEGIRKGESNWFSYILALGFWLGLVLIVLSVCVTKKIIRKLRDKVGPKARSGKPQLIGIISFSKDVRMWILYGITILGLILVVTDIIWGYIPEAIMLPTLSLTFVSFVVHSIVDGRNFKTYKLIKESISNETKH